jgi:hypothetical protein
MPRLTNQRYLAIHDALRIFWLDHRSTYGCLTSRQQHALHIFFRPAEALSDEDLVAHRTAITSRYPSLPHRAGRAVAALTRATSTGSTHSAARSDGDRTVTVRAIAKPIPDYKTVARTLYTYLLSPPELLDASADDRPDASGPRAA